MQCNDDRTAGDINNKKLTLTSASFLRQSLEFNSIQPSVLHILPFVSVILGGNLFDVFVCSSREGPDGLLLDFLADTGLDPLVFFLSDPLPHGTIGWITAQDIRVEQGHTGHCEGNDPSEKGVVCPRHRRQEDVEQETPDGMEKESEIHRDNDTDKLELCL